MFMQIFEINLIIWNDKEKKIENESLFFKNVKDDT
jgi:hypothetical protein